MNKIIGTTLVLIFIIFLCPSWAMEPKPLIKEESCPNGYSTSGSYCIPGTNARFAIKKIGTCPTGYSTSGKYCLAGKSARYAIFKTGTCPSGYSTSGSYCLSNKR